MKKYIIAALATAVLATGAIAAEKKELSPEQKEAQKKKMLEKYDKNKDGKLDDDEKAAMKAAGKKKKAE